MMRPCEGGDQVGHSTFARCTLIRWIKLWLAGESDQPQGLELIPKPGCKDQKTSFIESFLFIILLADAILPKPNVSSRQE